MIDISIQRDEKGRVKTIESKGHANYSHSLAKFFGKDKDIVCAAVSALLQTIPLGLESCLKTTVGQERSKGYLRLTMPEGICEKSDFLLESIILGLKAIEKKYSPHLKIEETRKMEVINYGS